ncbi:MAG: PAS domain S-box protein, partial [Candidatus Marinimicrobia bacterium]|nr:PAS domain S-box protein [Candidatus Neomarinimicrobiota bacterium]
MTKILVIDDEKNNLAAVKTMLKNLEPDYEVLTAASGIEGIKLAKAKQPDTILLDIQMPKMDGYEVCRRLRADKTTNRIPIIFLTAIKTSSKDRIKSLELGGDAYITKPIDEGELLATLHAMLRIKKVEDELAKEKDLLEEKVIERTKNLAASEKRYRDLVNLAPDGIATVDFKGNITSINKALLQMLGYEEEEVVGKHFTNISSFRAKDIPRFVKIFAAVIKGETPKPIEIKWIHNDGSLVESEIHIVHTKIGKGISGLLAVVRDITERKRTQEALEESEARFRTLSESAFEAIAVHDKGIIQDVNSTCCKMFGYDYEEIVGMSILDIAAPESKDLILKNVQRGYEKPYEAIGSRKDGSTFIGELIGKSIPYLGRTARVTIMRDITERKRVEENLKTSAAILQESQRVANLGSYALDISTGIWTSSGILDKLFGIEKDYKRDITGWIEIVHPDEQSEMLDYFTNHVIAERQPFDKEYRIIRKNDQKERWVYGLGKLDIDVDGKSINMIGTIQDITKRKQTQEALLVSEMKYRILFEKSKDAVLIIENGIFVDCNQATVDMLGYNEKDELLDTHPSELSSPTQPDGQDSVQKANEMMAIALREGSNRFEWDHKRANGEVFPVEVLLTAISTETGNQVIHTVWRDITERKQAEDALQRSEKKFRGVIEQSNDGIYVLQEDRFVFINPRYTEITGYKLEEINSKDFDFKTLIAEEGLIVLEEREKIRKQGGELPDRYIFKAKRKDGQKRDLEVSVTLIEWEKAPATLGVVHDVTERIHTRKKLEKALEDAKQGVKVKSMFMANMSHEIRTPLNTIMGFTDLIEESTRHIIDEEERKFFNVIRTSGERLMHTVHEIL